MLFNAWEARASGVQVSASHRHELLGPGSAGCCQPCWCRLVAETNFPALPSCRRVATSCSIGAFCGDMSVLSFCASASRIAGSIASTSTCKPASSARFGLSFACLIPLRQARGVGPEAFVSERLKRKDLRARFHIAALVRMRIDFDARSIGRRVISNLSRLRLPAARAEQCKCGNNAAGAQQL